MYNKKAHFVMRKRPFLIIVYAQKDGRRKKKIHHHAPGVVLFTPAWRQYHKSKDIRDTGSAFLLMEIHFARSKSFISALFWWGKIYIFLEKTVAAAPEEETVFFFGSTVENHPQKVICLADFDSSTEWGDIFKWLDIQPRKHIPYVLHLTWGRL